MQGPGGSAGKETTCSVRDPGSIPGLGRSPGEGNSHPLQYSSLENSMDRIVHGVTKSWTWLTDFHFHFQSPRLIFFLKMSTSSWKCLGHLTLLRKYQLILSSWSILCYSLHLVVSTLRMWLCSTTVLFWWLFNTFSWQYCTCVWGKSHCLLNSASDTGLWIPRAARPRSRVSYSFSYPDSSDFVLNNSIDILKDMFQLKCSCICVSFRCIAKWFSYWYSH